MQEQVSKKWEREIEFSFPYYLVVCPTFSTQKLITFPFQTLLVNINEVSFLLVIITFSPLVGSLNLCRFMAFNTQDLSLIIASSVNLSACLELWALMNICYLVELFPFSA